MAWQKAGLWLRRFGLDRYLLLLALTVGLAALAPARGAGAALLAQVNFWSVALLFFLYGAKLSIAATFEGLTNWRLQAGCLAATFLLFPALGLALQGLAGLWAPAAVGLGFLYIGCLPSTLQSSIAFTGIAGGNVAGAVCAASLSNLLGVVVSPVLIALLLHRSGAPMDTAGVVVKIAEQILLPFVLGQGARPWLIALLQRHKGAVSLVDRGAILLIVYAAFSAGVVGGIWQLLSPLAIAAVLGLCGLMLGAAALAIRLAGRVMALPRPDRLALLFCGSTKSLATGLPMAGILFGKTDLALIVLPLMLYHLLQLVAMSVVARHRG